MAVRAKFLVNKVEQAFGGYATEQYENENGGMSYRTKEPKQTMVYPTVHLSPVYAPDDPQSENHKFWQASPSGSMTLTINNPEAAEHFQVGQEYYLDFIPATA